MYISAKQEFDYIYYWTRDSNGKLSFSSVPIEDYITAFTRHPDGEFIGLDGYRVREYQFPSLRALKDYQNHKQNLYESDIKPLHKFLSDNFFGKSSPNLYPVNILLFDIETDFDLDDGKGYPTPENPYGFINAVSAYSVKDDEYYMLMVVNEDIEVEDKIEGKTVNNIICKDEMDLLRKFESLMDDFDIISAWNGNGFDIPYIMKRVGINFGNAYASQYFCRDGFEAYERNFIDDYGNNAVKYTFYGRTHLDMMDIFKNFSFKEYPSYSLDNICKEVLGEQKVQYDGDLGKLYREDPHKFFEYSLHDVYLMKRLHEVNKHLEIGIMMARESTISFDEIFGSIKPIEMAIYNYSKFERGERIILPDAKDREKEKFPGAFVYDTNTGIHKDIATLDLAGLYPSTIRMMNISPETFIMQCTGKFDDFISVIHKEEKYICVITKEDGEYFTLPANELNEIIRENGYTISANGSIFTNEFYGLLPEILTVWAVRRDEYKELKAQSEGNDKAHHDLMQQLQKLYSNTAYGITSNIHSRFYDIDIASSITLSGQMIGKWQGYYGNECIERIKRYENE